MSDHGPIDEFQVLTIPPRPGDQWPLTGRYVEVVWSGLLGPTATLLARRLAFFVEAVPTGEGFDLAATGRSLGVDPARARHALGRLNRFGIVTLALDERRIGVSGLAPGMSSSRVEQLDLLTRQEHDRLLGAVGGDTRGAGGCASTSVERLRRLGQRPAMRRAL